MGKSLIKKDLIKVSKFKLLKMKRRKKLKPYPVKVVLLYTYVVKVFGTLIKCYSRKNKRSFLSDSEIDSI